jgi:16S rRNA (uracil1498-N3)-methyltransferase
MIRFFIKTKEIRNKIVVFDQEQSKKIRKVLRMQKGDKVIAFDGKGWEFTVELEKITNDFSLGKVISQNLTEHKSNIVLYQALPKNLKVEFIIQKCTELGVDKIVFFESDFSQVKASLISEEKVRRWRKIATESAEQCGRIFVPEIELSLFSIFNLQSGITGDGDWKLVTANNFVLDQDGEGFGRDNLNLNEIGFFVGPEGGFSQKEKDKFKELGIKFVKISENILRSETAGMAFLAQLQ